MKIKHCLGAVLFLLLIPNIVHAEFPKKTTNIDWLLMSGKEKADYVESAMKRMQSRGVMLQGTPAQYIASIDEVTGSPELKPTTVDNIFTTIVIVHEPGARKILSQSKEKS